MIVLRGQTPVESFKDFCVLTSSEVPGSFRIDECDRDSGFYALVSEDDDRVLSNIIRKPSHMKKKKGPFRVARLVLTRYPKERSYYGMDVYLGSDD